MNLKEFGSWAIAEGSVANPPPNYKYKGECVSLIQQLLYLVLGIPFKARGNAKDWATNPDVLTHFNKLPASTSLQKGDILVYGSNYGGGYGHLGFIDANGKYFDQNGINKKRVGYQDKPFGGYICVLRSKTQMKIDSDTSFVVRVDKAEANVRTEPNTTSKLVMQPGGADCLKKGDTFKAVGVVDGENVNGNNKWYKSAKGNYVWSTGLIRI